MYAIGQFIATITETRGIPWMEGESGKREEQTATECPLLPTVFPSIQQQQQHQQQQGQHRQSFIR